jgi:hypothetical protein
MGNAVVFFSLAMTPAAPTRKASLGERLGLDLDALVRDMWDPIGGMLSAGSANPRRAGASYRDGCGSSLVARGKHGRHRVRRVADWPAGTRRRL